MLYEPIGNIIPETSFVTELMESYWKDYFSKICDKVEEELRLKGVSGDMALKIKDVPAATKVGPDYSQHLVAPVTAHTTVQHKKAGEDPALLVDKEETVHPGLFHKGMSITVAGGRTLNLGNYESARIDVSITSPCDKESLQETYEWATIWVSERLDEAVKTAKGE